MNVIVPALALLASLPWLLSANAAPLQDPKPAAAAAPVLPALAWMAGEWRGKVDGADVVEWHSDPAGGTIVMASKELRDGRTSLFDFGLIRETDAGVAFVPYPHGKPSKAFLLSGFDAKVQSARFSNEKHDFPRHFVFAREGDKLTITLTGDEGGKPMHIEYALDLAAGARPR
jgi:hypothetical protein